MQTQRPQYKASLRIARLIAMLCACLAGAGLAASTAGAQAAPPMLGSAPSAMPAGRAPKAADLPAIVSAHPAVVKLEAGGDPVLATLRGSRMELIGAAYAYLNGQPRPEVSVGLKYVPGKDLPRRGMTLTARQGAPAGEYELRLDVEGYLMAVPLGVFKILVAGEPAKGPAPAAAAPAPVRAESPALPAPKAEVKEEAPPPPPASAETPEVPK